MSHGCGAEFEGKGSQPHVLAAETADLREQWVDIIKQSRHALVSGSP